MRKMKTKCQINIKFSKCNIITNTEEKRLNKVFMFHKTIHFIELTTFENLTLLCLWKFESRYIDILFHWYLKRLYTYWYVYGKLFSWRWNITGIKWIIQNDASNTLVIKFIYVKASSLRKHFVYESVSRNSPLSVNVV